MTNLEQAPSFENKNLSIVSADLFVSDLKIGSTNENLDPLAKLIIKYRNSEEINALIGELRDSSPTKRQAKLFEQIISPDTKIKDIVTCLKEIARRPGSLEGLSLAIAEKAFCLGGLKPSRVAADTYNLLRTIAEQITEIRSQPIVTSASQGAQQLQLLRTLDRQILDFCSSKESLKSADYVALNAQHIVIASTVKAIECKLVSQLPKALSRIIIEEGIFLVDEVRKENPALYQALKKLTSYGIVHRTSIADKGDIFSFASAVTSSEKFEAMIPPRVRELISNKIGEELKMRYSGRLQPIGISELREEGVPSLLDRRRVHTLAEATDSSTSLVVLTLKYLYSHGLVNADKSGFSISRLGHSAGLGLRSVRFVQRERESGSSDEGILSFDKYLKAAEASKENFKSVTYQLTTKNGAAPWIYLLDELTVGNARIDTKVIAGVLEDISRTKDAFIVGSNLIQGDPAILPQAMRTSIHPKHTQGVDVRDYNAQIRLVKDFIKDLNRPTIQLHGKKEIETAGLKADVQQVRDLEIMHNLPKSDENDVKAALSRLNEISARAGRKYNAKLHSEILEFVSNIVMPLEMKLGRELMEAPKVREKIGLDMNELEIVRDISSLIISHEKLGKVAMKKKIDALYQDFLTLPEVGADYLNNILEVVFPDKEKLAVGSIVSRGGAKIQFNAKDGTPGLSMLCLPEARMGISENMNPTAKLMSVVKSNILVGSKMPDIICVASTGQPFVSMTAGGQLIVSADSLQSSEYDQSYLYTQGTDSHKRRRWGRGGDNYAGCIAFSGGIHEGVKTDAYTIRLWNKKIQEVIDSNIEMGKPEASVDIYVTSDWQTGSPTAKPATWVRGLFWAVLTGQKDIVINGDLLQGQNYGRAVAEMQLTGLVGIEDQQAFIGALLQPVLDMIKELKAKDVNFEIPKFTILTGNHETNSQSGKGGQGIWFLQSVVAQIESFYRGAFGSEIAESKVVYPKKFVDRLGTDVDYSHIVLDYSDLTGFRIAAQHYVGIGAKGSSSVPPIAAASKWGRSMENELRPVHGFLLGHWHTQSITQQDGLFYAIFGANADKSGFEHHLGYPTTVPGSGRVRLHSHRPPELFFVTDPYLHVQEKQLLKNKTYRDLVGAFDGSLENFIEAERVRHQNRDQKAFRYDQVSMNGPHVFLDGNRKIKKSA